jgi:DNA processing protein
MDALALQLALGRARPDGRRARLGARSDLPQRAPPALGALVSEFPHGTAPRRTHFPRRNRAISALSPRTLVVEAAAHGGSPITAQFALEQGREVFAILDSIGNPLTRGCHALIRTGATPVESPEDILQEIGISFSKQYDMSCDCRRDRVTPAATRLDKGQKILLDAMAFESASIDALVERTGFPSHAVASMLVILEFQGMVGSEIGGRYVRL